MPKNARIVITGATGQVGLPLTRALARENTVFAVGRFADPAGARKIAALGAEPVRGDLATGDLSAVSSDVDLVLNFAVARRSAPEFDADLAMNAEGAGLLFAHCRPKRAFVHCSSAAVYQWKNGEPLREGDPLGDHHRVMMPTYSLCKIAAEAVVRFCARQWRTPTTIARLGVPYGDNGGWPWYHLLMMKAGVPIPVHPSGPNRFPLFHEDDLARTLDALIEAASVPATVLNWAGSEDTSIEAWCGELARLTGLAAKLDRTEKALAPLPLDVSALEARAGKSRVAWREGLRRMLVARNAELLEA
jgi:nucleoside-diphosphate-sugar epimerase